VPFLRRVLETVGYRTEVERTYPEPRTRDERWQTVMELCDAADNHVRRAKKPGLRPFLEEVALAAAEDRSEDGERRDQVSLMTLHAAKGLEFPRVYLVGLEEGLLPHARAVAEDSVEEERRLAYVGVTRAQEHLTVTWAAERSKFGTRVESQPSRFVFELRDETPPKDWIPVERMAEERATRGRGAKGKAQRGRKETGGRKAAGRGGARKKATGRRSSARR
jgi:superfamily I DNA/RNA helicase